MELMQPYDAWLAQQQGIELQFPDTRPWALGFPNSVIVWLLLYFQLRLVLIHRLHQRLIAMLQETSAGLMPSQSWRRECYTMRWQVGGLRRMKFICRHPPVSHVTSTGEDVAVARLLFWKDEPCPSKLGRDAVPAD